MGVFPSMLLRADPLLSIGCREPKANRDLPAKLWANCPSPPGSFLETDCACSRKGQFLGRLRGVLTCVNRTRYGPWSRSQIVTDAASCSRCTFLFCHRSSV